MIYRKNFESWDEFVGYLRTSKSLWHSNDCASQTHCQSDWFGCDSWESAIDYAVKGHPVGRAAIDAVTIKVTAEPEPLWESAPVGAFPCIPAYAAGAPEDMFTQSEMAPPVSSPIVRIVVNMTASAAIKPHEIVNRGAALVTLIDQIQSAGRRVELIAAEHSSAGDDQYRYAVAVKRPEEAVDMDRIGLVFATPIFLRRFMFRMMECTAPFPVRGYGKPQHYADEFRGADLVIPQIVRGECDTPKKANEIVRGLWKAAQGRAALAA